MIPTHWVVTGATGSLGRALVKRLLDLGCSVLGFSRCEVRVAQARQEEPRATWAIGDVRDPARLRELFRYSHTIVHAAALKRVDDTTTAGEMLETNVLGTRNVLEAAPDGTTVIFTSSDKAVEPINTYGKSKALAEDLVKQANGRITTHVTRYGNVIGSRGSLFTIWREALREGRPLVATKGCTRFFLTLDHAVDTIFESTQVEGGTILVPAHLPAFSIVALAEWLSPSVERVEVRPGGEKLHEWLLSKEDVRHVQEYQTASGPYWIVQDRVPSQLPPYLNIPWASFSLPFHPSRLAPELEQIGLRRVPR